jgi:hypothetical protein
MERNMHDIEQMIADAQAREAERRRQREDAQAREEEWRRQEKITWLTRRIGTQLGVEWLNLGEIRVLRGGTPALFFSHQGGSYALSFSNSAYTATWILKRFMPDNRIIKKLINHYSDSQQVKDLILLAVRDLSGVPEEDKGEISF